MTHAEVSYVACSDVMFAAGRCQMMIVHDPNALRSSTLVTNDFCSSCLIRAKAARREGALLS